MERNSIIALVFLILGTTFIISLLKSLWKLLNNADNVKFDGSYLIKLFAIPLITFMALMIFVLIILPKIS